MNFATLFGWNTDSGELEGLPEIFPIAIKRDEFIRADIINIYAKILTDTVERINGLSDEQTELLWDNCLKSAASDGLITMLSKAMSEKKELYLVYDPAVQVIREATQTEKSKIAADYAKNSESSTGVYISFKNYVRSDMVKLYSGLEFCTVAALNKSMNLSKAVQFKMSKLRGAVALSDSAETKAQANKIAKGLGEGKDVIIDAEDSIETAKVDLTSVEASIDFLNQKRSFYLGMPESYINGEQTGGLGTTGENDTKAIERGLKNYYFSILKPVLEAIFGVKLNYKSQDFRQIGAALEALKTFSLVGEDILDAETQREIINGLLDIQTEGKNA